DIGESVQMRCDPVSRGEQLARDLRIASLIRIREGALHCEREPDQRATNESGGGDEQRAYAHRRCGQHTALSRWCDCLHPWPSSDRSPFEKIRWTIRARQINRGVTTLSSLLRRVCKRCGQRISCRLPAAKARC